MNKYKIVLIILLSLFAFKAVNAQKATYIIISDKKAYKRTHREVNYKSEWYWQLDTSSIINDAQVFYNKGKVYFDTTLNAYYVLDKITDSCWLEIKHPNFNDTKIKLKQITDYYEKLEQNKYVESKSYSYRMNMERFYNVILPPMNATHTNCCLCGDYVTPKYNELAIIASELSAKYLTFIDSIGLEIESYKPFNNKYMILYILKKKNNENFKKYNDEYLLALRGNEFSEIYSISSIWSDNIYLNQIYVRTYNELTTYSLKNLFTINGVKCNNIYKIGRRNRMFRVHFNNSLGYGILDELQKICMLNFVREASIKKYKVIELDE